MQLVSVGLIKPLPFKVRDHHQVFLNFHILPSLEIFKSQNFSYFEFCPYKFFKLENFVQKVRQLGSGLFLRLFSVLPTKQPRQNRAGRRWHLCPDIKLVWVTVVNTPALSTELSVAGTDSVYLRDYLAKCLNLVKSRNLFSFCGDSLIFL